MKPTVLENFDLPAFLDYIIDTHAPPTTLIVCSSKEAFLMNLLVSIMNDDSSGMEDSADNPRNDVFQDAAELPGEAPSTPLTKASRGPHSLLRATLHNLSSTRTIKLAFCTDLTHLLAFLSLLPDRSLMQKPASCNPVSAATDAKFPTPTLAILNPIALHRPTTSFSAQGLNRTFATAAETAKLLESKLVVAECVESTGHEPIEGTEEAHGSDEGEQGNRGVSPWDEEVSMLNVTTKTFGAGEKGWVGRTVTVRRIAERWCTFQAPPENRDEELDKRPSE